jgi:hypothetical protein
MNTSLATPVQPYGTERQAPQDPLTAYLPDTPDAATWRWLHRQPAQAPEVRAGASARARAEAQPDSWALQLALRGADVDEFVLADAEWLWQTLCELLRFVLLVALAVMGLALATAVREGPKPALLAAAASPTRVASTSGPQNPGVLRLDTYAGP